MTIKTNISKLKNQLKRFSFFLFLLVGVQQSFAQTACFGNTESYFVDEVGTNESTGTITSTQGTDGSFYEWRIETTGFAGTITRTNFDAGTNRGGNRVVVDWGTTPAGDYTLEVRETSANGCPGDWISQVIQVLPNPTAPTIVDSSPVCSGSDSSFTINGEDGAQVEFTITGGTITATSPITLTGGTAVIPVTNITTDVTLELTQITGSNGCSLPLTGVTETITVQPAPSFTSIAVDNADVCELEQFTYTITGTAGADVAFNINGANRTETLDSNGLFSETITTQDGDTNYTITVTNIEFSGTTCGGAVTTDNVANVTVNPLPNSTLPLTVDAPDACNGSPAVFTIMGGVEDEILTLSINGNANETRTFDNTGTIVITIPVNELAAGDQVLEIIQVETANANSCPISIGSTHRIEILDSLNAPNINAENDAPYCVGENAEFSLDGGAGGAGLVVDWTIVFSPSDGGADQTTTGQVTLNTSGQTDANITFPNLPSEGIVTFHITRVANANCDTDFNLGDESLTTDVNPNPETTTIQF